MPLIVGTIRQTGSRVGWRLGVLQLAVTTDVTLMTDKVALMTVRVLVVE